MATRPASNLSLSDWTVLAVIAERPTHGWPIVRQLGADGPLGRIWTVARPVVYRSLTTLADRSLIEAAGEATGQGPRRTIFRITPAGRRQLRRWLGTPVEHVRDVRTELLVKLALLDRAGASPRELVEAQLAQLAPILDAASRRSPGGPDQPAPKPEPGEPTEPLDPDEPTDDRSGRGFDEVLAAWRGEQTQAVDRFLRSLI